MYKILTIDGKDYKLEYNVEAALYKNGIDRLIEFLGGTFGAQEGKEIVNGLPEKEKVETMQKLILNLKNEMTNLPNTALELFYMGLLEHHGPDGDGSILTMKDAKHLVSKLFAEQPEDGICDFATLLSMCTDQMGEDGFFKRTGLEKILAQSTVEKPNRATRRANTRQSGTKS